MPIFLHIGFAFRGRPKVGELEPVFGKAIDWVRYAPNCWIVYTTSSPRLWMARLRPFLSAGDQVFIVRLDLETRSGWLPKWVWEWLKTPRP